MAKTIIFDFDGTIADSLALIVESFNNIAPAFNLPKIGKAEKRILRNYSVGELIKKFQISSLTLIRLITKIKTIQKQSIKKVSPNEGILKILQDLKKNNIRVGIVTSNSKKNVLLFLEQWHIKEIDFIFSEKNLFGKAKVIKNLIKKQKLVKDDVFYVGDEVRDIEAAHQAKIQIIAVDWGFNSKKRLAQAKPDFLISQPKEILKITKS